MPNSFSGISDIEQHVLSVNYAINFVLSNMARIIRVHAHPKTVATGLGANQQLALGVDDILVLPSEKADVRVVEMQSDLGSTLEMYKRLKEILHEVSRVPEVATGKVDNIGALSGVALQILYQSLVEKTATKQLLYGDMLTEVCLHAMEIGGIRETHSILIHWPDVLPKDPAAEANAALVLEQVGVSRDTLLTQMGYDAQAEAGKKAEEDANARQMGANMLQQFNNGALTGQNSGALTGQNSGADAGDDAGNG